MGRDDLLRTLEGQQAILKSPMVEFLESRS